MESSNSIKSMGDGINFTTPTNTDLDITLVCPISSCNYEIDSQYNSNIPNITANSLRYNHLITPVVPIQYISQKANYSSISPSSSAATSYSHCNDKQHANKNISTFNSSNSKQKMIIQTNIPLTSTTNLPSTEKLYNSGITPIIRIDGKSKSLKQKWKVQKLPKTTSHLLITQCNKSLNYFSSVTPKTKLSNIFEVIDVSDSDSDDNISHNNRNHADDKHIGKRKRKKELINHFPIIKTNM